MEQLLFELDRPFRRRLKRDLRLKKTPSREEADSIIRAMKNIEQVKAPDQEMTNQGVLPAPVSPAWPEAKGIVPVPYAA